MALAQRLTRATVVYDDRTSTRPVVGPIKWQAAPGFGPDPAWAEPSKFGSEPLAVTAPRLLPAPLAFDEKQQAQPVALQALQSWEGVVLEVGEESFFVRLVDLDGDRSDEEVEIYKDELSDFDLGLLQAGAIFYWTIGYRHQLPKGSRERVSRIRFRRMPAWSDAALAAARERAEALACDLNW